MMSTITTKYPHPMDVSYSTVPSKAEVLDLVKLHYGTVRRSLSPMTTQVLLELEARATVRTLRYKSELNEHIKKLEAAPTSAAEEWAIKNTPRYPWMTLSEDELIVINRRGGIAMISSDPKALCFKGTDVLEFTRQVFKNSAIVAIC